MTTRRFRTTIATSGAAVVLVAARCGDSPDPGAPVDPEDRTTVDTPIDSEDVPQADIPQNLDPEITDTVPGATPGPGPDDVDGGVESGVPDANTPGSTSTVVGGARPPG